MNGLTPAAAAAAAAAVPAEDPLSRSCSRPVARSTSSSSVYRLTRFQSTRSQTDFVDTNKSGVFTRELEAERRAS